MDKGGELYVYKRSFFQLKVQLYPLRYFLQKKEYPIEVVYDTIEGLEELNPDFISVTYGAGGSSKIEL